MSINAKNVGTNNLKNGVMTGCFTPKYGTDNHSARSVIQLDKNGKKIKKYDYMAKAADETGADPSAMTKVCRGYRQTAGGYHWIYGDIFYGGMSERYNKV